MTCFAAYWVQTDPVDRHTLPPSSNNLVYHKAKQKSRFAIEIWSSHTAELNWPFSILRVCWGCGNVSLRWSQQSVSCSQFVGEKSQLNTYEESSRISTSSLSILLLSTWRCCLTQLPTLFVCALLNYQFRQEVKEMMCCTRLMAPRPWAETAEETKLWLDTR